MAILSMQSTFAIPKLEVDEVHDDAQYWNIYSKISWFGNNVCLEKMWYSYTKILSRPQKV